ncbi:hypothetical protein [Amphritea sp. HPY]|uniref:hypothetical protein n=1 Tax=Amphritea sp. HPY TaxID=3421652 RepID=UPI003D7CCF15
MYSIESYINELISRVKTASDVERKSISVDGWQPIEHRCHDNVARLCELDSAYKHVYGFLFSNTSELGFVSFIFHSVVKDSNGNLIDITPTTAREKYSFLASGLPDEAYEELMYMYENEGQIPVPLANT